MYQAKFVDGLDKMFDCKHETEVTHFAFEAEGFRGNLGENHNQRVDIVQMKLFGLDAELKSSRRGQFVNFRERHLEQAVKQRVFSNRGGFLFGINSHGMQIRAVFDSGGKEQQQYRMDCPCARCDVKDYKKSFIENLQIIDLNEEFN